MAKSLVISDFSVVVLMIAISSKLIKLACAKPELGMYSGVLSESASPYEEDIGYAGFANSNDPPDPNTFFRVNFDTNKCKPNASFVWCLPKDYNLEKHPFSYYYLENKSLPWDYQFKFVIDEISNVNDKTQSMMISMYFAVSWLEPRLQINNTAVEWGEDRTGPMNQVNESPETLKYLWYPELEIYGLETFTRQKVLKEMSGVRIMKNKTINYELNVHITISCQMNFDDYPLDAHACQFQVGSYYDTEEVVKCNAHFIYDVHRQRSLQHLIQIEELPSHFKTVRLPSGVYSAAGFQVKLQRKQMQFVVQVYLPSAMFVIVSWVSFLVKPEVVPGRMAMLVTLFLVLINIFNSVREQAPISSSLNAVDLYLVVCIFFVFAALIEYAVILLLLKKRRKPRRTIDEGLMTMFQSTAAPTATGAATNGAGEGPSSGPSGQQQSVRDKKVPHIELGLTARKQALVDNIDAWAMWISPPVFVVFNAVYWVSYRHVGAELFKFS